MASAGLLMMITSSSAAALIGASDYGTRSASNQSLTSSHPR